MEAHHSKPVVAIVDDQTDVRDRLAYLINTLGFDARSFVDVNSFLSTLSKQDFACLIIEMNIQNDNGISVLKVLKRHKKNIPVIMLSSDSTVSDVVKAMRAGCIDFVEKPFVDRVMVQKIKRAVNYPSKNV